MSIVDVVAVITAKDGSESIVEAALKTLAKASKGDHGCISYDLFQSRTEANELFFVENWESMAALKKHMNQPFFVQHVDKEANPGLVVPWTYLLLKRISPPGVGAGAR